MQDPVANALETQQRFLRSPLKHLGYWQSRTGRNTFDIIPPVTEMVSLTIEHVDAFSFISEWFLTGEWENAGRIPVRSVDIGIGRDGIPNMACAIESLNQVLQMFDAERIDISIECPDGRTPNLDGIEFLNRVRGLRLTFHGSYEFGALSLVLEHLTFLERLEILYDTDESPASDEPDRIIIEDHPRLQALWFIGRVSSVVIAPEDFDRSNQGWPILVVRNCPALEELQVARCNVDLDSSSPFVIVTCGDYRLGLVDQGPALERFLRGDHRIAFPKFVGVKPEKFRCIWVRETLQYLIQALNQYQPQILSLRIFEFRMNDLYTIDTLKELDATHLSDLTIEGVLVANFDFLSKASHLRSVTIRPDNIEQFNRWNNSLEDGRRFQLELIDDQMVCRR